MNERQAMRTTIQDAIGHIVDARDKLGIATKQAELIKCPAMSELDQLIVQWEDDAERLEQILCEEKE